ncbi:MAG: hypothetical protein LBS77_07775 [Desulfovibrio sp.]|nr:hypothetical protein [Desulfovibrio sp.]
MILGREVQGAIAILGFVGLHPLGIINGVWQYIIEAKGRKPVNIEQLPDDNAYVEIKFADGETIKAGGKIVEFAMRDDIRVKTSAILSPLTKDEFSTFKIVDAEGKTKELANREMLPYFAVINTTDDNNFELSPIVNERQCFLHVSRPVLDGDGKWRFSEGEKKFEAAIKDEEFQKLVKDGMSIGSKDILCVILREEQTITKSNEIKTERVIKKILTHKYLEQLKMTE